MLLDVDNAEVYEMEEISNQLQATGKVWLTVPFIVH